MKVKTTRRKVARLSAGHFDDDLDSDGPVGHVVTEHGYVLATATGESLTMRFVWRGDEYIRTIDRPGAHWTAQGIVRPANEFAAEIASG